VFLNERGFLTVEALPTLVRYQQDDVEVAVHHGRLSYEIGAVISYLGHQYALAEIVRAVDPDAAARCGNLIASTTQGVSVALEELGSLLKRYGASAVRGDPHFFSTLEEKRKVWVEEYWLDGLARQVRPQAEEAFRLGDYTKAAELYSRFRSRLSSVEAKKLEFAEGRAKR
jgi:hypothetical protein